MSALRELEPKQRRAIAKALFHGEKVVRVYESFYEEYPDAHRYGDASFYNFPKTQTYQEDIQPLLEDVRTNPEARQFTQRPERIEALSDLLRATMGMLSLYQQDKGGKKSDTGLSPGILASLITAAAKLIAEIRVESEPYDKATRQKAMSPFEEDAALEDEVKRRVDQAVKRELESMQDGRPAN